jgi:hypothetical protein
VRWGLGLLIGGTGFCRLGQGWRQEPADGRAVAPRSCASVALESPGRAGESLGVRAGHIPVLTPTSQGDMLRQAGSRLHGLWRTVCAKVCCPECGGMVSGESPGGWNVVDLNTVGRRARPVTGRKTPSVFDGDPVSTPPVRNKWPGR